MARDLRVSVTTSAKKPDLTGFEHTRDKVVDEWNEKPPFFLRLYSLFSEFYFSPKCEDRWLRLSRLSRILNLEKILDYTFYHYYLF